MYTFNSKLRGFVLRITVIFSKFSYSLKTVAVFEETEMLKFSALVFSSCLTLSLCSVQSVPSLTTQSDSVVNRTESCQKVSVTVISNCSSRLP